MVLSQKSTVLIVFAAFGAVVGIHVGALPFLVKASDVSPSVFGFAGAAGMLANIIALALGGVISRHIGNRTMMLFALPLAFLATAIAMLSNSVFVFVFSFVLLSGALGTLDLFMNAEGAVVEHELGRPVFSSYHGAASLGMAGFAIVSSLISAWLAPWFALLTLIVPVTLASAAVYRTIPDRPKPVRQADGRHARLPRRALTFLGIAIGFNVACEVAAIQWAGQLLVAVAPDLSGLSGLGLSFFGLCAGAMRLSGDRLRARVGDRPVLVYGVASAVVGFVVLSFVPTFWIAVLAFAAVGCGTAMTFPCLFSFAASLVPEARAAAMGFVASVSGAPRILLPWLLGILAAEFSLGAVFAACAIVAASALAVIVLAVTANPKTK